MTQEMEYEKIEKLNPFFSIWLSTRKTIRFVLEQKSLKYSLILAAVAGIPTGISGLTNFNLSWWLILIGVFVLGPIVGLIGLGFGAVIYTWVGKWFGGFGTIKEMAQAMGVVMIPNIWFTPHWILSAVIVNNEAVVFSIEGIIWILFSSCITIAYSIWMIVIQSKAIGEVHQFSSGRGFATLIIPSIVFGTIVFIGTVAIVSMFI